MTEQRLAGGRGSARCAPALLAVLLLGTTAACSSGSPAPEPMADETPSSNALPTTAPSPGGPPTLPPEARGTSDKAAIAFVEHVIEVLNYSAETLDTSLLEGLADPDCAACSTITKHLQSIKSKDGFVRGGAWTSLESIALSTPTRGVKEIRVLVRFEEQRVVETRGDRVTRHPAGRTFFTFFVSPEPPTWRLVRIEGQSA